MAARVRAPALAGAGGWIGSDEEVDLADLRGHVVLLHFWTSTCVNCQRTAEELRGVERRFAGELVVLGVHSPKFAAEREHGVVEAAVARMRVEHPVLDDPDLTTWDAYAVRAWPTLVLVDQAGYEVARWSGEGHAVEIAAAVEPLLVATDPTPPRGEQTPQRSLFTTSQGALSFPGGVAVHEGGGRIAIADTGHDRVVVCGLDGEVRASHDGLYAPQGVGWAGDALLVAETGADRVWRIAADGSRTLLTRAVRSPWDVTVWHGHVVIAGAGRHVLVALDADGEPQVVAGTGVEERRDGPALHAALAQPSGVSVTPAGELAFVDAESSALRVLDRPGGTVRTLVGDGLFDWGDADGDADHARMQHPLGVAAGPDGALWVADTHNDALRVWRAGHLWTVPVPGLREPGGIDLLGDRLVVADTGNHRVVVVEPVSAAVEPLAVGVDVLLLAAGDTIEVELDVGLQGDVLDGAGGAPVRVRASASEAELLGDETAWTLDAPPARVLVPLGRGSGRVTVELRAATCGPDACRLRRTERSFDVILGD